VSGMSVILISRFKKKSTMEQNTECRQISEERLPLSKKKKQASEAYE